ncbi:rho guanine nucleotide exchange factor 28-like [Cololabis saira]|uniref:rho guanine nucleotide exchange factor 28-like n=1 Tax=Cololabis saira TaxID=129043 RepID=UPI002AD4FF1F|nr:rho guanine nucleotide exchange factor 28-like [Cololabis saira]
MDVTRKEVPLYGQVQTHITLRARAHEDAEFYVVARGSRMTHVTAAERLDDGLTLCFTVPGHDREEAVSVTPYICIKGQIEPCEGMVSLEYFRDAAQEAAEYLSASPDHLESQSYKEVLERFPTLVRASDEELPGELLDHNEKSIQLRPSSGDLKQLDENIVQAVANMDYPQQWKNTDSQSEEGNEMGDAENHPKEHLLHLATRLGLVHLTCFLMHQREPQRCHTMFQAPAA